MPIRILHTNDTHGTLTHDRMARLAELRQQADLYFDTGDAIKTGNLGIPIGQEPVWSVLGELRCTASVLGNRETHILESAFRAKLAGAQHPVLAGNLFRKDGTSPLHASVEFDVRGVRVAVFGVMVAMVTERMLTKGASAYLWEHPIDAAARLTAILRPRCDLLIALTHIGFREDETLAQQVPMIDVILGGHSHTVLAHPVKVGNTFICQGGSHNRFAGVYEWEDGELCGELVPLARA